MVNPLVIGALLVASAGTLYWLGQKPAPKKKKKKAIGRVPDPKWFLFGDECQFLGSEASEEETGEFVRDQLEALGGLGQLGEPPGNDFEVSTAFMHRFAWHMFEQTVSPVCVDRLTQTGAKTPPVLVDYLKGITAGVDLLMTASGYAVESGIETGIEGTAPVMGPSLVDTLRGV